jgi:hypothetical protein
MLYCNGDFVNRYCYEGILHDPITNIRRFPLINAHMLFFPTHYLACLELLFVLVLLRFPKVFCLLIYFDVHS